MRNSFKILFFYFLLFVNVISASSKNDIISINFSENVYSEKSVVPIINVNSSNINSFSTCFGTASQQQTFTVSGSGLSNDISISVPSGYEISLNGTTWSSTLSLAIDGSGNVSSTTISIRIGANASSGSHNGAVTISSGSENGNFNITGNVNSLPTILGSSNLCVGSTIQLTGSGTAAVANPWTSSTSNITVNSSGLITGISPGNSVITYVDSNGCNDTKNITVNGLPSATISTSTPVSFCSGGSVLLTANSGTGLTYVWKKNGAVIPSETNSTYTATTSGDYTVTVTNPSGCSATSSITVVTVYSNIIPVLGPFGTTTQTTFQNLLFFTRCTTAASAAINVVNQTLNQSQVASYTINWGDGTANTTTTSFTSNINHPYIQGFYTLTISLTTIQGCTSSTTYQIFVGNTPSGSLGNPGNLSGCAPKTITYPIDNTSNNTPGTQYIINFGDGQSVTYIHPNVPTSITHTYTFSSCGNTPTGAGNSPNSFVASMTTTNPCFPPAFTTVGPIIINEPPTPNFTILNRSCVNTSVNLLNSSNTGVIVSSSGCNSSSPFYWTISPSTGWTATGLGSNGGVSNDIDFWSNGVMNPSINFNTPGNYTITLYIGNSCDIRSISKTICIESPISPQFTLNSTSGCTPVAVTATDTSNLANNCSTLTYAWNVTYANGYCGSTPAVWNFTNNTTAASQNPSFNFVTPGTYTIRVTISGNTCGPATSLTQTVIVKKPPTASINTIPNYCLTGSISPTAIINSCSDIITNNPTYLWSFPGGTPSSSTAINPTNISYSTPGTYTVSLVVTNECGTTQALDKSFTIFPSSVAGTASANQTICSGSTPAALTLTGFIGSIQWQSSSFVNGPWTDITGATSSTLSLGPLTATRYYQAVVTNGVCPAVISNMVTITVNPASFGGTASINQSICTGGTPSSLTLSGNIGTIQWQSSTNNTSFTDIVGETSSTLVLGALNTNMYYQAVVTSGTCPSATSSKVTITVIQPSVAGSASADQTICFGTSPNPLSITGNTGSIQWRFSNDGTTGWTVIGGANGPTLTSAQMGTLTSTRYYQAVITNGVCPPVISNIVTITVIPSTVPGTASSNQTICLGNTPSTLILSGNLGTIQWQSSSLVNGPWTDISGATTSTLTLGALSSTMYYQAVVKNGVCPQAISTKVTITVNPLPTISGTLNVCIGTTTQLTGSPTAATLNPWGSSDTSIATVSNSGLVTGISPGTATITYTNSNGCQRTAIITVNPLPTISGTLFVCKGSTTQLTGSGTPATTSAWVSSVPTIATINSTTGLVSAVNTGTTIITYTNSNGCKINATVTVNPLGQVNSNANQSLCDGGIVNVSFTTNNVPGTTVYDWTSTQTPNIGLPAIGSGNISFTASNIGSGIATSTVVVTPTYTNGGVGCPGPTSQFTISVYPPPTISVHPTPTQDICVGGTVPAFNVAYINGYGNPDYQWFYNTSPTTTGATIISGAINPTYTPPLFLATGTYYYFARVCLNGLGCGCVFSNIAQVNVYGDPNATITPSTQTICQNTPPTPIVVTASAGIPSGVYTYQWYSNVAPNTIGGIPLVPAVTTSTFIPPTSTVQTNYYYCIISNGLNCNYTTPVVQVVTVAAPITHLQPTPTQTVCLNGTPTTLSVAFINGTGTPTYQWYSNTVNVLTGNAIAGATSLSYVPPTSATGTLYYYCIATYNSGGCTTATSNIAQVIVNPIQTITTQPLASQDICRGGTIAPLTVAYTDGVGTATYQWYSNTTNANTGGTSISGANGSSYTPPVFNTPVDYYYYAMVSLSGSGCGSVASATALVHVVADPTVTITPSSQTICQGTTPTNLVVTPSGGVGTFSYQWYSNTTNNTTTGTLISGANSPTFTPPNSVVEFKYYYCIITQTGLGCSVTSSASEVIIVAVPTISNQPLANQTICQNVPSTPLSVTVINGTGIPTYQWYSNTINSIVGGTAIAGATNATYSSTNINDTKYYYCIIQYSAGGCGTLTTNISTVIVNSIAFISNKTVTICSDASFNINPSGSVLPEIVPTGTQYRWFVNPTPNSLVSGFSDMIVPQSNITQTLTNNGAIPYDVVYNVTPITGSCQGLPFTITVTVNPKVKPNETINNVICNSNPPFCNGSILLAPTGGSPFNYQWSVPGATPTQTNLCSGNYWVDITDSYSCTYRFNYTVTVPPPMISVPAVNPINNTNCDIATGCNGIIQVAVSGGTPFASTTNPYQYQWFQVTSSGNVPINTSLAQGNISILQNICGGTYYLVVTDSVNCQKQFGPYTITDPAPLVITSTLSNYNGFQVSCNGGNNGSIGINVTGGNGPINVILNPLGPNTITLPNPANFTGLSAGNYTVVIRDLVSNCPDIIRNIVLTAPPALQATVTQTAAILCNGNFATYQAVVTGGIPFTTGSQYQYLWTPSNEITSSATNLPAGAYNVLVTDANGCTFNGSGVITQPSLLVATANITTPIRCFGGTATVTVTATGGVPNTTSGSPVYSGTGVFTVSAGVNVFTVTDFNGCQKSITINVTEPPLLQVTAVVTTPISCFGGNATVTVSAIGGVQNYTGTGTFSVPAGNNIPFTVTDANGCSNTVLLNITQPTLLVASATVTSPILCNGGTGVITISGTGGTPYATGPLYSGTGPITVSAGSGTYTISDANGCSASVPFTITQPTPVIATATIISPILCKGGTAIISVGATGGVPGSGYVGTGNYTVYAGTHTYFVRDSNGCISNTVTIVVTEPPLLVASSAVTSPVLCNGGTAVVTVTAIGGTPLYTINAGDYGNYTVTAGLHLYTVIDANGCRSSTSITVTQPGPLAFTIKSATNPNCFPNRLYNNGSICISITGGTNPFPVGPGWVRSTNISTPNDWCLNGLSAGTYTIAIADVNNCPANTRTLTLTRPTPITGFITSNLNVNCPIKNVSQTNYIFASGGIPGYVYNWSGGVPCAGPPNPQCMTTDVNGNYFVDVNDQEGITFGCIPVQFPVVVNLPVIGNPLMNISSSAMTICGVYSINDPISFTNVSTGNFTSIEWFVDGVSLAGANSVSHTFTTIGDHNITLVVNYTIGGVTCTYSITQTIAVTRGYDMIVPNAFTPANHDGINDNFKPEYNCMKELEMRVYDTWGSLLYVESGPTLKGWDGTINGHESENGNYIIVVRATTLFGAIVDYNGPFTLIK